MTDLKSVFETIVATNNGVTLKGVSGAGSTIAYTWHLRRELAAFARKFAIRSFFDAPCGDFNWMKEVEFPESLRYIGGDIATSLIEANQQKYAGPTAVSSISISLATFSPPPTSGSVGTASSICRLN